MKPLHPIAALALLLALLAALVAGLALWLGGAGSGALAPEDAGELALPLMRAGAPLAAPSPGAGAPQAPLESAGSARSAARSAPEGLDLDDASAIAFAGTVGEEGTLLPLAGVRVSLVGAGLEARTETDAQGHFELVWYDGVPAELALEHEDYIDLRAPRPDLTQPADVLLQRSARIAGRVVPAPAPDELALAHALVWRQAASSARYWEEHTPPIAADGGFELRDLLPGDYAVTALVPGRSIELSAGLHLSSGETLSVRLASQPGARVVGRVRRAADALALAGVRLRAEPRTKGVPESLRDEHSVEATSAADGSYALVGLTPGSWRVSLAPPWGGVVRAELEVPESGTGLERDFDLAGPVRLTGEVLDPAGKGVGAASVYVVAVRGADELLEELALGVVPDGAVAGACDSLGRFVLEGVPAGERLLIVGLPPERGSMAPGVARAGPLVDDPLAAVASVVVRLAPAFRVEGRVVDELGAAVAQAAVELAQRVGERWIVHATTSAGPDGRFVLGPLLAGRARVRASGAGFLAAAEELELAQAPPAALELVLARAWALDGLVLDVDGFAVPGVPVRIEPADEGLDDKERARERRYVAPDAFGRFRCEGLPAGAWVVASSSFEWQQHEVVPELVVLPGDAFVQVTLIPRARAERSALTGQVALAEGGTPSGVRVGGLHGGVLAIDGGRFSATGLTPTRHRLLIGADGHASLRLPAIDLAPGITYDLGRIELERAVDVVVIVNQIGGGRVDDARVVLEPLPVAQGGRGETTPPIALEPLGAGRYRTHEATLHAWRLRVRAKGYSRHSAVVVVDGRREHVFHAPLEKKKGGRR